MILGKKRLYQQNNAHNETSSIFWREVIVREIKLIHNSQLNSQGNLTRSVNLKGYIQVEMESSLLFSFSLSLQVIVKTKREREKGDKPKERKKERKKETHLD